ncbi:MAG: tetratricopeptide repeat protein, partial [Candidatus Aminicenantes bacterium]|nr:tetratricopeptide repeat protein [Candidatus Aminicenantes bacterium]
LETLLDVEKAFACYARCYKWLGDSARLGKELSGWAVPDKAAYVSRPPQTEKKLTGWTQWIEKNPVRPEQIINRIHCRWYLDSLKARNGKMLSLCFFIKGDKEQALKAAKAVIMFEPLERMMYDSRQPNSYTRLIRGYQLGWMRCMPQELALFSDKLRTAVLLGDFYYEIEDEERCEAVRRRLAEGLLGRLNHDQEASAKYRLAEILYRMFRVQEAKILLLELTGKKYKGAYRSPDALIGLGNIYSAAPGRENLVEAIRCYESAVSVAGTPHHEQTAMYYLASAYREDGRPKDALQTYRRLLKKYPAGTYIKLIEKYINKIEEERR